MSRGCCVSGGKARTHTTLGFVVVLATSVFCVRCFSVTTDFDGVAGVRPTDAGDSDTLEGPLDGDATTDGGGPPAPVDCAKDPHLLCTNFDLGGGLTQGGWINEGTGGGEPLLDGARSVSKPASFRSTIPIVTTKTNAGGILRQSVRVGTYTALRYGFDMFISACTTTGGSTTLSAMQASGTSAFGLVLDVTNKYVFAQLLLDKGEFRPHELSKQPVNNRWFRVETRVELSTTKGRMQVAIDGVQVLDVDAEPRAPATDILLNVGANATGPVGKCDVNYDNVTFDKE